MKFSIVIPVRSINDFLKESISQIKKLEHKDFEVLIVVDYEEKYPFNDDRFKILVSGPISPGEKRNFAVENSIGDVIAFLDDDAYPTKEWLTHAEKIFSDEGVYALGAPAMTPVDAPFLEKMSGKVLESKLASAGTVYRHTPMAAQLIDDYPTVNLFVRKTAFKAVGGFTKEFWPGEDTKLCLDLVKKYGKKFLYDPRPIVYHHRRNLIIPHLKQISRYGQHRGQFARILPETSRLPGYFVPSIFLLGLVFGPLVSTVYDPLWFFYWSVVLLYLLLLLSTSISIALKEKTLEGGIYVLSGIFLTHITYGINFIIGLVKRPDLKLKAFDLNSGNYLEG